MLHRSFITHSFGLVLLLTVAPLRAQHTIQAAASFGLSDPTGQFYSTNRRNGTSGYAQTGSFYELSLGYSLGRHFGVAAMIRSQRNWVDTEALMEDQDIYDPYMNTCYWAGTSYLAGGYLRTPGGRGLEFDVRALLGMMDARSPELRIGSSNICFPGVNMTMHSAQSNAFAYLIGGSARKHLGPHGRGFIQFSMDYLRAEPEFEIWSSKTETKTRKMDRAQPMGTMNLSIGLGWTFGARPVAVME